MTYQDEVDRDIKEYKADGFEVFVDVRPGQTITYILDAPCERCRKYDWLKKSSESGWLCELCWSTAEMEL